MTIENQQEEASPGSAEDYLLSIEEAARSGTTVQRLIEAGSARAIELLIECPTGVDVVLRPTRPVLGHQPVGRASQMRTPEYLVVDPQLCRVLSQKSSLHLTESAHGYRKTHNFRFLQHLPAADADTDEGYPVRIDGIKKNSSPVKSRRGPWGVWSFQIGKAPFSHIVQRTQLLVRASQLHRFMGWKMSPEATSLYAPIEHAREDGKTDFMSLKLMRMCEAANMFWGNVVPHDRDGYPHSEKIIEWFMTSNSGFTTTSATEAARLIAPEWANTAGRRTK